MPGLEMMDGLLKEAITLTFESRVAAYLDASRKLMAHRLDPGWSFVNLFLVKDAYAFMLESVGKPVCFWVLVCERFFWAMIISSIMVVL